MMHGFADTTNADVLEKALEEGSSLNAMEKVCTVNADNIPTTTGHSRSKMRLGKMWHRATYVIIRHIEPNDNNNNNSSNDDANKNDAADEEIVLVQRRSTIKDYCPAKLDATPGGVVGYGESYSLNAMREMKEEMNIDVEDNDVKNNNGFKELFTFPYEDEGVKVWGGLFEVVHRKPFSNIKIQEEEVSEIHRLSIQTVRAMVNENPNQWMPDGLHAIKLYLQYRYDVALERRWGNFLRYTIRPKVKAIFFDCDDCLYFDGWKLASKLTSKIEEWCVSKKGLPPGKAYELYKKHGTALKGLLAEGYMNETEKEIDEYLADVHDIPISEHLSIDNELRNMLLKIDPSIPKYIFTASVRDHAERCLRALGIEDLFVDIIDVKSCNLATKHSTEAFEAALQIAGVQDPDTCIFLDDSKKNLAIASSMGIRSFLVGRIGRDCGTPIDSEHAEKVLERIHHLPNSIPEIFMEVES